MNTKEHVNTQQVNPQDKSGDAVAPILSELEAVGGHIDHTGIRIPPIFAMGDHGPVVLIEDRNAVVKRFRKNRHDPATLATAFGHARSVTVIHFAPSGCRGRLGQTHADWQALTLTDRLQTGAAVVINTTSDRLRFWLEEARKHCGRETVIEYFDGAGVSRVSEGGL